MHFFKTLINIFYINQNVVVNDIPALVRIDFDSKLRNALTNNFKDPTVRHLPTAKSSFKVPGKRAVRQRKLITSAPDGHQISQAKVIDYAS